MVAKRTGLDPVKIGNLGTKIKFTMTEYPFLSFIVKIKLVIMALYSHLRFLSTIVYMSILITPPQNRGGVIFLLKFVCLSVCVCVCVCVSVNKIPA